MPRKSCKFCTFDTNGYGPDFITEGPGDIYLQNVATMAAIPDGGIAMGMCFYTEINYCPLCGRPLVDLWSGLYEKHLACMAKHFDCVRDAWDCVIASMDTTDHFTWCEITGDDESMYDPWEKPAKKQKYKDKLKRLTKDELMELLLWVTSSITQYMDVRAAYDSIYSVITQLEEHNSFLRRGSEIITPEAAWSM